MQSVGNSLIDELETALESAPADRRLDTLRRITALFLEDADRLGGDQIAVFEELLLHLMEQIETNALSELSSQLAPLGCTPATIIRRLAHHQDISVASPVLAQSQVLTSDDLIEIASSHGQKHLLAIAGRKDIDEDVSDVLIDRGDRDVCFTVASNVGSKISSTGFRKLVNSSRHDALLAEKTGLRHDLPEHYLNELIGKAADAVRERLLSKAPAELKENIRRTVAAIEACAREEIIRPHDFKSAAEMVARLKKNNELTEQVLLEFAKSRQYEATTAALAALASASIEIVRPLMRSHRNDGLIVACRAANLNWETTQAVIMSRFLSTSDTDIDQAHLDYRRLSSSAAQRTLRFWQIRGLSPRAPIN